MSILIRPKARRVIDPPFSQNLLAASNYTSGWAVTGVVITPSIRHGPNNDLAAAQIVETSGGTDHYFSQTYTKAASAIAYEFIQIARCLKGGSERRIGAFLFTGDFSSGIQYVTNLATGVIAIGGDFGTYTAISRETKPLGNGWWYISYKFTTPAVANIVLNVGLDLPSAVGAYAGDGASGVELYGGILRLQ